MRTGQLVKEGLERVAYLAGQGLAQILAQFHDGGSLFGIRGRRVAEFVQRFGDAFNRWEVLQILLDHFARLAGHQLHFIQAVGQANGGIGTLCI